MMKKKNEEITTQRLDMLERDIEELRIDVDNMGSVILKIVEDLSVLKRRLFPIRTPRKLNGNKRKIRRR